MGREFRSKITIASCGTGSADRTMWYVTAPATMVLEIKRAKLGANLATTSQQMSFAFKRFTANPPTTLGTGSTLVMKPPELGGASPAAAAFTGKFDLTVEPTAYDTYELNGASVPSVAGYELDDSIFVPPSGSIGLILLAGTYSAITLYGGLAIVEWG